MKYIISTLVFGALLFSMKCKAQIHTMPWDPGSITSVQKKYIDSCQRYMYDTLGDIYKGSLMDNRRIWLDGNYFEYIEIDSVARTASWKFRKATNVEKEQRKQHVIDETTIHSIIGKELPDLEFVDLKGKTYNINDLENKIVYMNFWFVGCQPCELERVKLNQLYEKHQNDQNVIFLSFSNSTEAKTKRHLEKKSHFWPIVILNKDLKKTFSYIEAYPTNIILNNKKFEIALAGLAEGTFLVIDETLQSLTN